MSRIAFNPKLYKKCNLQELILVSIYLVINKQEICTFERLVAECFKNFPEMFSFKRYPEWPDSLKFDRPLRNLRAKGLILGNPRDKFSLSKYGESKAKEILERLYKKINSNKIKDFKSSVRSAEDRIIEFIKSSEPYRRYLNDPKGFSISEQEFRNLLRCTLESSDRVVMQNLQYYLSLAEEYNENEIKELLIYCQKKFIRE